MMQFAEPDKLHWLWLAVPLGAFLYWGLRRRAHALRQIAGTELLAEIGRTVRPRADAVKAVLLWLAAVLAVFGLARPQWGFEWREVHRQGLDILLAVDTSKSMLTQDVRPDRLARTKLAVRDLLKRLDGDRVGLIAFSGEAFLVCPLTVDYNGFLLSLDDLGVDTIPRGGTDIAVAIREALRGYQKVPGKYKVVIILTDGENLEGEPLAAAKQAKEAGVRVYTVGIGTQEGELIRVPAANGGSEFLKDASGNIVKSRLNEPLLQQIALATGGAYVRASGAQFGLDLIYERELSKLERRDIESRMQKKYYERFQVPLALALVLLVAESCFPRRRARPA